MAVSGRVLYRSWTKVIVVATLIALYLLRTLFAKIRSRNSRDEHIYNLYFYPIFPQAWSITVVDAQSLIAFCSDTIYFDGPIASDGVSLRYTHMTYRENALTYIDPWTLFTLEAKRCDSTPMSTINWNNAECSIKTEVWFRLMYSITNRRWLVNLKW